MIKIIGIAAICLILSVFLKSENKVFSLLITSCGAILIFFLITEQTSDLFSTLKSVGNSVGTGTGSYITLMMKILGISIITQIVCDLCRDNGETALAAQTEIASKITVLAMLLPLFQAIINVVIGLTK